MKPSQVSFNEKLFFKAPRAMDPGKTSFYRFFVESYAKRVIAKYAF